MVVIDPETCIEFKTGKCKKTCVEACGDRNAIDFKQTETIEEIEVGAIILATGFKTFDAERIPEYGYGVYPNVYTRLEVERLVNAVRPDRRRGRAARRHAARRRSGSSTASARATRTPTAGARGSAACTR